MGKLTPIIFIVGQTASGKSELALRLARELGGEIIAADSQTVRRDLNIGTAKPSPEEQAEVSHHMLDVVGPYDRFSVAEFQKQSNEKIKDIFSREKVPIVVGGTGLYIDSLYFNYSLDDKKIDDDLEEKSVEELQQIIQGNDWELPENENNPRHLIGVIRRQGQVNADTSPRENSYIYGIMRDEEITKQRIHDRIAIMIEQGLLEEAKLVFEKYGQPDKNLDAICYPILARYFDGEIDLGEAKELFARGDWQYARRQKAWFKRNQNIEWFTEVDEAFEHIISEHKN